MAWFFNLPEPSGQPIQPGQSDPLQSDETSSNRGTGFDAADLFTRGRCGNCGACPKVWRMDLPFLSGGYDAFAGTVYLHRMPYKFRHGENGEYFVDKCSWGQRADEQIPGANKFRGDFDDGWHLTFEGSDDFNWALYTPTDSHTLLFDPDGQSVYRHRGLFHCLEANDFLYFSRVAEFDFHYLPELITLVPFYA